MQHHLIMFIFFSIKFKYINRTSNQTMINQKQNIWILLYNQLLILDFQSDMKTKILSDWWFIHPQNSQVFWFIVLIFFQNVSNLQLNTLKSAHIQNLEHIGLHISFKCLLYSDWRGKQTTNHLEPFQIVPTVYWDRSPLFFLL